MRGTTVLPSHAYHEDTGRFSLLRTGVVLPIQVSVKKGRYYYRTDTGHLVASGMTLAEFVHEFWGGYLA